VSIVPATSDDILNLAAGIGQRSATYRFELFSGRTGEELGVVHPKRESPPSIEFSTTRTIKRTLTNVAFDPDESNLIDALSHRLRVIMVIGNVNHSLGQFIFTDSTRVRRSNGRPKDTSLMDYGFILDQPITSSFGVFTGENIATAVGRLLDRYGIVGRFVEGTSAIAGAPMVWGIGTSGAKILDDLATQGGYFSPYFDRAGFLQLRSVFDPAQRPYTVDFDAEPSRVIAGSIGENDDLLNAPNRFIVIDNANTDFPIVGSYDVPSTAPHSIFNRGFVVPKVEDRQGMSSPAQAQETATAIGLQSTLFQRVNLSTPPDPRHDGYEIVHYDSENWLEIGWSLTCQEGGQMHHQLARAYPATV
jgi:hypothetical protein